MNAAVALGLDIGTSGVKAVALNDRSAVVASSKIPLPPREGAIGCSASPQLWWAAVEQVLSLLRTRCDVSGVRSLGVTTLCPSLLLFDRHGEPLLDAILYADDRAWAIAREYGALRSPLLASAMANRFVPGVASAIHLLRIRRSEPELFERVVRVGHATTWAVQRLTGEWAIDPTHASYSGLAAVRPAAGWLPEWLDLCGIAPGLLPPIVESAQVVGDVRPSVAAYLGLPAHVQVTAGAADTACAALACGICTPAGGILYSVGTTNVLTRVVSADALDPIFMNRRHALVGRFLAHGAISSAGAAMSWASKALRLPNDARSLLLLAAQSVPGANGLLFWPAVGPERGPWWNNEPEGAFLRLSQKHTEADMARAVVEGLLYAGRLILDEMEARFGPSAGRVACVGGGADSNLVIQIAAQVFDEPIHVPSSLDAAAVGAALLGLAGATGVPLEDLATAHARPDPEWTVVEPACGSSVYPENLAYVRHYLSFLKEQRHESAQPCH